MTKPISAGKTYIDTFTGHSGAYKVFAYIKNPDGTRTYLPADGDPETTQKVRSLAKALLEAHDAKQEQESAPAYAIKKMNAQGLVKTDNSVISHDFHIEPISSRLATEMETTLGNGTQANTVRAQDIWDAFETTVRRGIQAPDANRPVQVRPEPVTQDPATRPVSPQHENLVNPIEPPAPTPDPAPEPPSITLHKRDPKRPATSIDLDLEQLQLNGPDWYTAIPDRVKLRIVNGIYYGRCFRGNIYGAVWEQFEALAEKQKRPGINRPVLVLPLLKQESERLSEVCQALPSSIPPQIRNEAEEIYRIHKKPWKNPGDSEATKNKIESLMNCIFDAKEALFIRLRQQAEADNITIADWDKEWAKHHYLDNIPRLVEALARWLDND